jgi:hypothetical protein
MASDGSMMLEHAMRHIGDASNCNPSVIDSIEEHVRLIRDAIYENMMSIIAMVVILVVSGLVIFVIFKMAAGVYTEHRLLTNAGMFRKSSVTFGKQRDPDANVYDPRRDPDPAVRQLLDPDLPPEPELDAIKRKMERVESQYSAYNRALTDHLAQTGRQPDDLMDARIMSRNNDDFEYSDRKTAGRHQVDSSGVYMRPLEGELAKPDGTELVG